MNLLLPVRFVAANPNSISVPTLVVEAVIFLAMVWAMEKLVFSPIRQAWRERNAAIQTGLEASTATRDEAERGRQEVRRILSEARRQSQVALDGIRAEGEKIRSQNVEEATAEFQRLLTEARAQIRAEQSQALVELKDLVVDLALEAASKVTAQPISSPEARSVAAGVVGQAGLA